MKDGNRKRYPGIIPGIPERMTAAACLFNVIRKPAKKTGHDQETGTKRPAG